MARVRAASRVSGWAIGRGDFAELLRTEPRVAVAMLPVLARRLADAEA
jgi:CRP-like cAMP-binding protein